MKNYSISALILSLTILFFGSAASAADYAENQVIVLLRDSNAASSVMSASAKQSSAAKAASLAKSVGASALKSFPELTAGSGRSIALFSSEEKTADELISALKDTPEVIGVAKNYMRKALAEPNDPRWASQWGTKRIKAPEVWEAAATGSDAVYAAVLDTGVIYDHPDLAANISGKLPDGTYGKMFHDNGTVTDVVRSGTPSGDVTITNVNQVDYATVGDVGGHGTHVAGIIGAVGNNSIGVAGVNWKVKILPVGVFTVVENKEEKSGWGTGAYDIDIIAALNYIVELKKTYGLNIRAANLSLGRWTEPVDQDKDPYAQAVKMASDAGIIVCMAAGNEEQDIDAPTDPECVGKLSYPACFRFDNTISVGASNENDGLGKSSGSNYSTSGKWVDVMAPGDNIMSTTPFYSYAGSKDYHRDGYDSWNGTSMATPMVTGAAALLCAVYPNKTANEIKTMLMNGAENVLKDGYSKYGLLNVYNAYLLGRQEDSGSSSGGCSAGFAALALIALLPLAMRGKKK